MLLTRFCLLAAVLSGAIPTVQAQSSVATYPWSGMLGAQLNFLTPHDHSVFLRARAERSADTDYNATGPGKQLQQSVVLGGIEWLLTERWSGGAVEKITFDPGPTRTFQTGGFLRHCGRIGSVQFRKRALIEHVARSTTGSRQPNTGRIRLRVDLDRTWYAGALGIRPRLAYEAQFDFALKAADSSVPEPETRTVDVGILRAECAFAVGEHVTLVPYLTRRTLFTVAVQQKDIDGNVKVPAGPRNLRFPSVGFDVRVVLPSRQPHTPVVSRDLPTFEGFQD